MASYWTVLHQGQSTEAPTMWLMKTTAANVAAVQNDSTITDAPANVKKGDIVYAYTGFTAVTTKANRAMSNWTFGANTFGTFVAVADATSAGVVDLSNVIGALAGDSD